ncbi:MAG: hypothetical protein M3Z01_04150 [Thermoproteota archaeon]|nr:hypothetical protein [Thermoproteota archaeon]
MSDYNDDIVKEEKKTEEEVPITPIQIFILTYLYSEEIQETQKKVIINNILRSNKSHLSEFSHHVSISLRDISLLIPYSLLPDMRINEEHIYNQLKILEYNRLLGISADDIQDKENTLFFITIDGIILIKQIFSTLSDKIQDKKVYEEDINKLDGNKETKDWLKELWVKFKDKPKDDISDIIIEGVKIYGVSVIVLLIDLLSTSTT